MFLSCSGERPAARYVLLHEDAGGDWDLPGTWKRIWPEGWNLPLQVENACDAQTNNNFYLLQKEFKPSILL